MNDCVLGDEGDIFSFGTPRFIWDQYFAGLWWGIVFYFSQVHSLSLVIWNTFFFPFSFMPSEASIYYQDWRKLSSLHLWAYYNFIKCSVWFSILFLSRLMNVSPLYLFLSLWYTYDTLMTGKHENPCYWWRRIHWLSLSR